MILTYRQPLKFSLGEDVKLTGGSENGSLDIGVSGKIIRFDIGSYRNYARVRRPDGNVEDWVNFNNLNSLRKEGEYGAGFSPQEIHSKLSGCSFGFSRGRYSLCFLHNDFYPSDVINWVQTFETFDLPVDMRRERENLANFYDSGENYSNEAILLERDWTKVGGVWRKFNEGKVEINYLGIYPNEISHDETLDRLIRLCAVDSFLERRPLSIKLWEGHPDLKSFKEHGFKIASVEEAFYRTGDSRLNLEYSCEEEKAKEHLDAICGGKK